MTVSERTRAVPAAPLSYDGDKPPERIEEDIVHTRDHLEATIDELERRLAPRQFIDNDMDQLLRALDRDSGQLMSGLRQNAVPLLLIAAGFFWLFFLNRTGQKSVTAAEPDDGESVELWAGESVEERFATGGIVVGAIPEEPMMMAPVPENGMVVSQMENDTARPPRPEFDRAAAGNKPTSPPADPAGADTPASPEPDAGIEPSDTVFKGGDTPSSRPHPSEHA